MKKVMSFHDPRPLLVDKTSRMVLESVPMFLGYTDKQDLKKDIQVLSFDALTQNTKKVHPEFLVTIDNKIWSFQHESDNVITLFSDLFVFSICYTPLHSFVFRRDTKTVAVFENALVDGWIEKNHAVTLEEVTIHTLVERLNAVVDLHRDTGSWA